MERPGSTAVAGAFGTPARAAAAPQLRGGLAPVTADNFAQKPTRGAPQSKAGFGVRAVTVLLWALLLY